MGYARIQREPFSTDSVLRELRHEASGGVTFYVGTVRGDDDGRPVERLEYEAYEEMAQATLERLRQEVVREHDLLDAIVIHRTGVIPAGDPILLVALSGRHRGETFRAVQAFMDGLKSRVPIWKKEDGPHGSNWLLGEERRREPA